jgi:hypothetical protein
MQYSVLGSNGVEVARACLGSISKMRQSQFK